MLIDTCTLRKKNLFCSSWCYVSHYSQRCVPPTVATFFFFSHRHVMNIERHVILILAFILTVIIVNSRLIRWNSYKESFVHLLSYQFQTSVLFNSAKIQFYSEFNLFIRGEKNLCQSPCKICVEIYFTQSLLKSFVKSTQILC